MKSDDYSMQGQGSSSSPSYQYVDMAQISVASRIPDFWTDQPRLWFLQTEAILAPQKLADEAKYNLLITKLGKDVIAQLTDFLMKPPETKKFEQLKDRLLAIFEESEARKLQKLISEMELGDQRPSQLLARMTDLARGKVSDETLRLLWQGHLPASVRAVLAVADTKELSKLSDIADKVLENVRPTQILEVTRGSNSNPDTAILLAEIARINTKLANLEASTSRGRPQFYRRNGTSYRSRSNSRNRFSRRNPNSPDWLCFYHYRYRTKAHKCTAPCNWKPRGQQQQQSENQ